MVNAEHPRVRAYLRLLSHTQECRGATALARTHRGELPHPRTIARWQRDLMNEVHAYPTFTIEALGLSHVHLFLERAVSCWERLPFAVECSWITERLGAVRGTLYVHCIVPTPLVPSVERLVADAQRNGLCASSRIFVTGSGWQHLNIDARDHPELPSFTPQEAPDLVRQHPLVIAVVLEMYQHPGSLPALWRRICDRLGPAINDYLPSVRRPLRHNGKRHIRDALQRLYDAGLTRQHEVRELRRQGVLEVLVLTPSKADELIELLEEFRGHTSALDTYHGTDGTALLRLRGDPRIVLDLLAGSHKRSLVAYVITHPGSALRCRYEESFQPRTATWHFKHEELLGVLQEGRE